MGFSRHWLLCRSPPALTLIKSCFSVLSWVWDFLGVASTPQPRVDLGAIINYTKVLWGSVKLPFSREESSLLRLHLSSEQTGRVSRVFGESSAAGWSSEESGVGATLAIFGIFLEIPQKILLFFLCLQRNPGLTPVPHHKFSPSHLLPHHLHSVVSLFSTGTLF